MDCLIKEAKHSNTERMRTCFNSIVFLSLNISIKRIELKTKAQIENSINGTVKKNKGHEAITIKAKINSFNGIILLK